jgi:hypothetical protein
MDEKQRDARWARKHLGRQPELDRHDALAAYHVQRGRAKFWKRLDAHAADQRRADQIGPVGEPA